MTTSTQATTTGIVDSVGPGSNGSFTIFIAQLPLGFFCVRFCIICAGSAGLYLSELSAWSFSYLLKEACQRDYIRGLPRMGVRRKSVGMRLKFLSCAPATTTIEDSDGSKAVITGWLNIGIFIMYQWARFLARSTDGVIWRYHATASATAGSYIETRHEAGAVYHYRIRSENTCGNSPHCEPVKAVLQKTNDSRR